ncbi:MAG: fatty acid desaturase family protein [Sphingomonadaceae bacterium]
MDSAFTIDRADTATRAAAARARLPDDVAMLRTAAELTRDLGDARPLIYWSDFLGSAAIGYAGLYGAVTLGGGWAVLCGIVAVLALYRGMSFIHEVTHVKHATLPGFRIAYNLVVGIPLLIPSFMYEGVHNLHHTRVRYGTADDPEYLPLARMKPWSLPLFVIVAALAPVGLLLRYGLLAPLSLVNPSLRAAIVARYSSLQINPAFRRRAPEGDLAAQWRWQEAGASLWAIALLALAATGAMPLRTFLIVLGVASSVAVLNQVRTLVAHLWENDGEPMTVTAQYLDSVNVPPPALLPALWAPVGLRYHALHHLLPSLPYHALGEAHRRLAAALGADSPYHRGNHPGLGRLVGRIAASTMRGKNARV